jgi:formylglycine-generating enzyme required for sulfatase activity
MTSSTTWPGCRKDRAGVPHGQRSPTRIRRARRLQRAFPFPFDEGKGYSIAEHANTYGPADGYSFSSPAGSYPPNAFGMYDMHGNVYERVADCEHTNYIGAPTDGSAWMEPNCESYQSVATTGAKRRCFHVRATATTSTRRHAGTGSAFASSATSNPHL